jgi:DNA gyrase subunit B
VAAAKKTAKPAYGADSIQILEGLEAVRKRPGMYIGSTGERGLHHLVWEVVDNAVDEAMAGYATKVDVRILEDGSVAVTDDGRGIPVAMHASGIPTVDVVMTQLHAGGKFDSESYAVSGGLHGVGVSVVNALSTRLEVEIKTDGYEWMQSYDRSVPGTLKQGEATKNTGTTVRFWADPTIFETTNYDFETVARRLQEMAFLNKGLTITLVDERVTATEVTDEVVSDTAEAPKSAEEKAAEAAGRSTTRAGSSTTSSTSTGRRPRSIRASSTSRARAKAMRSRSRCSGTPATPSRCTPSRTRSTLMRAALTRKASGRP